MSDPKQLMSQVYLALNHENVPDEMSRDLLEVSVESTLHLPDVATIILNDSKLRWIDTETLKPGAAVTVQTRAGQTSQTVFEGEIVEIEPDFRGAAHRLIVRAFDLMHRLSHGRHVRSFQNVNDGDLVRKIAADVGLQVKVGPTPQTHPYVLQSNETNLEFLRRRAAMMGYMLCVIGKTLHCEEAPGHGRPVELEWGKTLHEFHPRMATAEQVTSVTVRGWDPQKKESIVGKAGKGRDMPAVGQVQAASGGDTVKKAFSIDAERLVTHSPVSSQAAADSLAQSMADRLAGRFIEAEGICSGNPAIVAGTTVDVQAVGKRFGGAYRVTSATHIYNAREGYTTHFGVTGQTAATLHSLLAADSRQGSAGGLAIAVVTDNQDPDGLGRVKVKFPWLSDEHASFWARMAVPGGGPQRGMQFLPEVNDEVLVGFDRGDMQHPFVLGGLWNGVDPPPKQSSQVVTGGKVQQRIIQSRTGHTITLDDGDGGGGIQIADANGNHIVIDSAHNSMSLTVKGDLSLSAAGHITLSGAGITLDSGNGKVEVKGMGISMDAKTGAFQAGGMGIKMDGGAGTVDISGTLITLN